jgi:DNA-binding PadR family transcriptional regulator
MEFDLEFARKLECSEDDKRDCLKIVENLLSLSKKARTYGMLSLAKEAEENSSFLLTKGIQLATDGAKPHVVRSILEFYILSGNYVGKELLERCLILEGIVAIQEGLHPKLLKELLLSFFGEEDYEIFENELNESSKSSLTEYLERIKNAQAGSSNARKLSKYILKLNDATIEELLKDLDTSNLAKAIQNMSGNAKIKIFKRMQKKGALLLKETLEQMEPLSKNQITEAQEGLVKTLSELKKRVRI